jgi:predicted DNA-binding protein
MPASRQISIRLQRETDAWLEHRAGGSKNKASFLRELIEREMAREKESNLLEMFNEAATELTEEDHHERESLLGGFAVKD